MVAQIEPDICVSVDKSEILSLKIPASVFVVVVQRGSGGDAVVLAGWKGPGAPLLGVVDLEDARDEGGAVCGRHLVTARLGTG